jgi:hypothetical protein
MNLLEQIENELLQMGPEQLEVARKYLQWIKIRRRVTDRFYFAAHWITRPRNQYHWVR